MTGKENSHKLHCMSRFRAAEKGEIRPTVRTLDWHPNPVPLGFEAIIAFSTDSELRLAALIGQDWEMLHQRKASNGRRIDAIKWNPSNGQVAFSSGALNGGKGVIACLEYFNDGFQKLRKYKVNGHVTSLTWEMTGKFLVATVVSSTSTMVILKRLSESRYKMKVFQCSYKTNFTAEIHPGNQTILTVTSTSNEVSVWAEDKNSFDWKVVCKIPCIHGITSMRFSKNGFKVAMLGMEGLKLFTSVDSSDGEPCQPRLYVNDFVSDDGRGGERSLKRHCESSISLDWSSNNSLLTGSQIGTMCIHKLTEDGSSLQLVYFRFSDVHSCNPKGPVTCVAWNPLESSILASAGVDGLVILWQLLPSNISLQGNRSYALEGLYFLPERTRMLSMSEEDIRDVPSVSSVSTAMSTTFNSDSDLGSDSDQGAADNVDPIDAAVQSLVQQISLQQKQSTKSLKVLVETLSNVKESVKGSKGMIDQILSTVQNLDSGYQHVTSQVEAGNI